MFHRMLMPPSSSFFLLGPRGGGKSTWLRQHFHDKNSYFFDLLDLKTQHRLMRKPESLEEEIRALPKKIKWIIIDEVQKIPKLLDVVHRCIESTALKFALSGSSARKLKRGSANLLAGRAFSLQLFPLTSFELENKFDLKEVLNWGSLPKTLITKKIEDRREFLNAYAHLYLKEEIQQEQIVRKIEPFNYFLEVAAQYEGRQLNFSKIAKDINIDTKTVISFFKILEDTLMGFILQPYHRSIRKRQKFSPKFYFFDIGVRKTLEGMLDIEFVSKTSEWGRAFESWVINEILRINVYLRKFYRFSFLSVPPYTHGEIDLIIEKSPKETTLVEIKSSTDISQQDVTSLIRYRQDFPAPSCYLLSLDPNERIMKGIHCLPWQKGIRKIFSF